MDQELIFIGCDAHLKETTAQFIRSDGSLAHKMISFEHNHKGLLKLDKALDSIVKKHPNAEFYCGIEASGPYWYPLGIHLQFHPLHVKVSTINPLTIKEFKKLRLIRVKTDPIDAKAIAEYMRQFRPEPTGYFSEAHMTLRQLARGRKFLVKQRSAAINQLRAQLAYSFPEISGKDTDLNETILAILIKFPTAEKLMKATDEQLKQIRFHRSGRRIPLKSARHLRKLAQESIGVAQGDEAESYMKHLIRLINFQNDELKQAEEDLVHYYKANFSHTRMHTIPGVGLVSAAVIMGEILDADRFEDVRNFIGYIGLYPEWKWSADKKDKTWGMTKKGNKYLKHSLFCCVLSALVHNPIIKRHYALQLSRRKKKMVAIGSCMRKLASLMFGVMKSETDFDPLYEFNTAKNRNQKSTTKEMNGKEEGTSQSNNVAHKVVYATHPTSGLDLELDPSSKGT
jgi:transposase